MSFINMVKKKRTYWTLVTGTAEILLNMMLDKEKKTTLPMKLSIQNLYETGVDIISY
jgi:hypothetical protein